ncbi:MAG TPA: STAS domain-containing protein [Mycobacterium sp.]|nr:STAS domain-containing protein [Mycobacterium sp.]
MGNPISSLMVSADTAGAVCLLTVNGVLDSSTYRSLRDAVIKVALDEPQAVLIDVDGLDVPSSSAWSVFTSARWHVSRWPDVPIVLVCGHVGRRRTIARTGMTRYVPVHATIEAALAAVTDGRRARRRVRTELPASLASLRRAREFVAESLAQWSHQALIPVTTVVANVFVENVLQHTASGPVLILESDGTAVTVSVQDGSSTPAARHEDPYRGGELVSGLAILASICRAWGSTPMPSGKTVWAVIGPENQL